MIGLYELRDLKLARTQMFYFDETACVRFLKRAAAELRQMETVTGRRSTSLSCDANAAFPDRDDVPRDENVFRRVAFNEQQVGSQPR